MVSTLQDQMENIHIWHGSCHHHFKRRNRIDLVDTDESHQHRPTNEVSSHPPGSIVAPMAGLVVKVLVKDGEEVLKGQPALVLEAMKMEVCLLLHEAYSTYVMNASSCKVYH